MLEQHDIPLVEEIDAMEAEYRRIRAKPATAKRGSPERNAQRAVVSWLRAVLPPGSKVAAIVNEQAGAAGTKMQRARFGAARRKSGVLSAMPDLVCALPEGRTVWIEMKAPNSGVLRSDQDELHRDFRAIGHQVGVATCIDTARHVLRAAGVPLRESAAEPSRAAVVRVEKRKPSLADRLPI